MVKSRPTQPTVCVGVGQGVPGTQRTAWGEGTKQECHGHGIQEGEVINRDNHYRETEGD